MEQSIGSSWKYFFKLPKIIKKNGETVYKCRICKTIYLGDKERHKKWCPFSLPRIVETEKNSKARQYYCTGCTARWDSYTEMHHYLDCEWTKYKDKINERTQD